MWARWIGIGVLCGVSGCGSGSDPKISYTVLSRELHAIQKVYRGVLESKEIVSAAFTVPGRIQAVHVRAGDRVLESMELARLDPGDLEQQKIAAEKRLRHYQEEQQKCSAQLRLTEQMVQAGVKTDADRLEAVQADAAIQAARSDQERAVQQATRALDRTVLRAKTSGMIAERAVNVGDFVGVGQLVCAIYPEGSLQAVFVVPKALGAHLQVGDPLVFEILGTEEKTLSARVQSITPNGVPDPEVTATIVIRPDRQVSLNPGMHILVRFFDQDPKHPVWQIPRAWVQTDAAGTHQTGSVFVYHPETERVSSVPVRITEDEGKETLCVEGLQAGQRVVSRALGQLKDRKRVQILEMHPV